MMKDTQGFDTARRVSRWDAVRKVAPWCLLGIWVVVGRASMTHTTDSQAPPSTVLESTALPTVAPTRFHGSSNLLARERSAAQRATETDRQTRTNGVLSGMLPLVPPISLQQPVDVNPSETVASDVDANITTSADTHGASSLDGSLLRINCGGPTVSDDMGRVWESDAGYVSGGKAVEPATIDNVDGVPRAARAGLGAVFDSERWSDEYLGEMEFRLPVPSPGQYEVSLILAEVWVTEYRARVFGVTINGRPVLDAVDIVGEAGFQVPLRRTLGVVVNEQNATVVLTLSPRPGVKHGPSIYGLTLSQVDNAEDSAVVALIDPVDLNAFADGNVDVSASAARACGQISPRTWMAAGKRRFATIIETPNISKLDLFAQVFLHTRAWTWKTDVKDHLRESRGIDWALIGERSLLRNCTRFCHDTNLERVYWRTLKAEQTMDGLTVPPLPWLKKSLKLPRVVVSSGDADALGRVLQALQVAEQMESASGIQNDNVTRPLRVLILSGSDFNDLQSSQPGLALMKKHYFDRVYAEALEYPISGVRVAPIGLTAMYSKGHTAAILVSARLACEPNWELQKLKPGVLASWGHVWRGLDSLPSRQRASAWLKQPSAAWIGGRQDLSPDEYYSSLSKSRFLIAPRGAGVQSPKIMEAILMRTIPIVEDGPQAFRNLAALGYPIVLVSSWSVITPSVLDMWWKALSPLLNTARWMLLRDVWLAFMLHPCPGTIHNFVNDIFSGKCPTADRPRCHGSQPSNSSLFCSQGYCHTIADGV